MARPPLEPGTHGNVRVQRVKHGKGWVADTLFCDWDGENRRVHRTRDTRAKAEQALQVALRDRQPHGVGELTSDSTFADCADRWLAEVRRTERGTTYDRYKSRLNRVLPALGKLRLRQVGTGACDRFLTGLTEQGLAPATVRGYRAVLSGVMGYAVRMGALTRNPVRDVAPIRGKGKRSRALTAPERDDLLAKLDEDELAVEQDLPSLMRYLLGSGVRIGEALALRWRDVDLVAGVAVHGATLARETGVGLLLHESKTLAGVRIIRLPSFVITMLQIRYPGPEYGASPVFPSATGGWRDPVNTAAKIRRWRKRAGYEWFTSHVCRHTAITLCSQAGIEPREISGHHGHTDPGFTQRWYFDMAQQSGAVAEALDAAYRPVSRA